jgi:hypothetical protein
VYQHSCWHKLQPFATANCDHLNNRIAAFGTESGAPSASVKITDCGVLDAHSSMSEETSRERSTQSLVMDLIHEDIREEKAKLSRVLSGIAQEQQQQYSHDSNNSSSSSSNSNSSSCAADVREHHREHAVHNH